LFGVVPGPLQKIRRALTPFAPTSCNRVDHLAGGADMPMIFMVATAEPAKEPVVVAVLQRGCAAEAAPPASATIVAAPSTPRLLILPLVMIALAWVNLSSVNVGTFASDVLERTPGGWVVPRLVTRAEE
jgi:hypothetical protein